MYTGWVSSHDAVGVPIPSEPTADLLAAGLATFGKHVLAVRPGLWAGPTPCSEWTVADLVRHLVDEHRWVPPLLGGLPLAAAARVVAAAGSQEATELPPAWEEAAAASLAAWSERGAARRVVHLARGPTVASRYLTELIVDLLVHSWDLARAIDADPRLPEDLVAFSLDRVAARCDLTTRNAPPVPAAAAAQPIDRLIAQTRRRPSSERAARHLPPLAG